MRFDLDVHEDRFDDSDLDGVTLRPPTEEDIRRMREARPGDEWAVLHLFLTGTPLLYRRVKVVPSPLTEQIIVRWRDTWKLDRIVGVCQTAYNPTSEAEAIAYGLASTSSEGTT